MGHAVGDVARQVYDPQGVGVFIDVALLGFPGVFEATRQALAARRPVFEAAFTDGQALALADVLLPVDGGQWRMVEVKSSTSVKPYHRDDVALQARLARSQGIDLAGVSVAHVDSSWCIPVAEITEVC
jgi:predicted RecB family nuclease